MSKRPQLQSLDDPDTLRQFVAKLREGIYITTPGGKIVDANPAFLEMLGIASVGELERLNTRDLVVDPAERERQHELLRRDGAVREFEIQLRGRDGEVRTMLDTCYIVQGQDDGEALYHGILVDITDRKRMERQLLEWSFRDPLTGCFNRRYLERMAAELQELDDSWGALVVDVDNLKRYNDRYGHHEGDRVLVQVSRFLMARVRPEDPVFRTGGDEFVVLVKCEAPELTENLALRLRRAVQEASTVPFSLGWAVRRPGERVADTIDRADLELIQVRQQQRRRVGD